MSLPNTSSSPALATQTLVPAIKAVWLNGRLVDPAHATVSVFDHGLLYGDGVFEGIRVYNGRIFKCKTHLERLFASAEAVSLKIPYTTRELTDAIRETVAANERSDAYIRLCVTRGPGVLGIDPFRCDGPTVFIIAASIQLYPQELYDQGMPVIVARTIRNDPRALSPAIKSMNYLNNILAKIEARDAGVREAVMLNTHGNVAECTGDNIFIMKDGALIRPPLSAGMLEGVTMRVVEQIAAEEGIPVRHQELTVEDLFAADEMFLTGTAAEVIPVNKVDQATIGDGKPGPITKQLHAAFHAFAALDAPED